MTPRLLSARTIEGTTVENPRGKDIGEIKDIMIDLERGYVAYVVLSFGGLLGFGEKLFAVPIEAFRFDMIDSEETIILDVDKEKLDNAPGFDKEHWPDHPDRNFISSVYTHYGYQPYWSRHEHV